MFSVSSWVKSGPSDSLTRAQSCVAFPPPQLTSQLVILASTHGHAIPSFAQSTYDARTYQSHQRDILLFEASIRPWPRLMILLYLPWRELLVTWAAYVIISLGLSCNPLSVSRKHLVPPECLPSVTQLQGFDNTLARLCMRCVRQTVRSRIASNGRVGVFGFWAKWKKTTHPCALTWCLFLKSPMSSP